MTYTLDGTQLIFALDRAQILDISANDTIEIEGFEGVSYTWTNHDSEFLENNPDADVYLEVERGSENRYMAKGILLKEGLS